MKHAIVRTLSIVLACGAFALQAPAASAADGLLVELNKMEAVGGGCRVYMVFQNGTGREIASFKPDLVFFDADGVIADRLVVEGGPLSAGKTKVKLFDVTALPCPAIKRILLNDVRECSGGEPYACLAETSTSSRNGVEFIK